jgi:hypothetical protein
MSPPQFSVTTFRAWSYPLITSAWLQEDRDYGAGEGVVMKEQRWSGGEQRGMTQTYVRM